MSCLSPRPVWTYCAKGSKSSESFDPQTSEVRVQQVVCAFMGEEESCSPVQDMAGGGGSLGLSMMIILMLCVVDDDGCF
mgnify:CR=1 FL=1